MGEKKVGVREGKERAQRPLEKWLRKSTDPTKDLEKAEVIHRGAEGICDTKGRWQKIGEECEERLDDNNDLGMG